MEYPLDSPKTAFILKMMDKRQAKKLNVTFQIAFRDIFALQDEVESLRKRVAELEEQVRVLLFSKVGDN
jgi:predicted  nucleic acid-binding Zn-ribbon protein